MLRRSDIRSTWFPEAVIEAVRRPSVEGGQHERHQQVSVKVDIHLERGCELRVLVERWL